METEIDILNKPLGGTTLKEMSAMSFFQWVAKMLNGVKAYSPDTVELTALISSPPMSRVLPDDRKLEIVAKLRKLGVEI